MINPFWDRTKSNGSKLQQWILKLEEEDLSNDEGGLAAEWIM